MFYIYAFFNKLNSKIYIGKTKNLSARYKQHIYFSNKSNFAIHKAIKKYGKDNFEYIMLDFHENENIIYQLEEYYIKLFASNINGYNLNSGGLKPKHSKESKIKISNKRKGFKFKQESILKMKNSHKNKPNYSVRKLTLEQAIEIKQLYNSNNFDEKYICKKYSIGNQALKNLLNNKTYKDSNIITNIIKKEKQILNSKNCTLCKVHKPLSDFYRNKNLVCGHDSICKICNCNFSKIKREKAFIQLKENCDLFEIQRLYSIGLTIKELFQLFNISQNYIKRLLFDK